MELVACHLPKIGYLGTLLKPLLSYAPVKQRRWGKSMERISVPEGKIFKRLKYSSLFKGFLFFQVYSLTDTALKVAFFLFFSAKRKVHSLVYDTLYFIT